jgi:glycosidase
MYYGEEIGLYQGEGMSGDAYKTNSDAVGIQPERRFHDRNALGGPDDHGIPYIVRYQDYLPNSLLNLYKKLIRIRAANAELRTPNIELVATTNSKVFAYIRGSSNKKIIIVINGYNEEKTETLDFLKDKKFVDLMTGQEYAFEGGSITISPKTCMILKWVQ